MQDTNRIPVFDGHNDALHHLHPFGPDELGSFLDRGTSGHIDLPRARKGGFGGGFFAISTPSDSGPDTPDDPMLRITENGYEVRLASPVARDVALDRTLMETAGLHRLETESDGRVQIIRTADELETCLRTEVLAIVLHFEGAEPIDPDLNALDVFHAAGLRSVGIVWSRPDAFGHGVPFRFPSSPDTGPGLTDAGKRLVRRCNELGILVDVSHLNEKGFWDVARLSHAPIVATHSAAHAICPTTRNLTDRQLEAIRDSEGLVGVNFEVSAIRPDGYDEPDTPIEVLVAHVDYLVERIGIDLVGFGSDFDGARMPTAIGDVSGLSVLIDALRQRGYDQESLEKLAWRNWVRVLYATWC